MTETAHQSSRRRAGLRCAVTGWYGSGNIGDQLLAYSVVRAVEGVAAEGPTLLSTDDDDGTALRCKTCRPYVPRRSYLDVRGLGAFIRHTLVTKGAWIRLLSRLDLLVVGGGSLFHDRQPDNLAMWHRTLSTYRAAGARVLLYGIGLDEVSSPSAEKLLRETLALADGITVRDATSAARADELLGPGRARLAADPVLNCPLLPSVGSFGGPSRPQLRIGLNLRRLYGADRSAIEESGVRLASALLDRLGCRIVFIPMANGDRVLADSILARLSTRERGRFELLEHHPQNLAEHVRLYDTLDLVVAMRFHTLLLAAVRGVPVVGLDYDPKVAPLFNDLGMPDYLIKVAEGSAWRWIGIDVSGVVERVEHALAHSPGRQGAVAQGIERLRARERENGRMLGEVVEGFSTAAQSMRRPRGAPGERTSTRVDPPGA